MSKHWYHLFCSSFFLFFFFLFVSLSFFVLFFYPFLLSQFTLEIEQCDLALQQQRCQSSFGTLSKHWPGRIKVPLFIRYSFIHLFYFILFCYLFNINSVSDSMQYISNSHLYFQDIQKRILFFHNYARVHNFNPTDPRNWYSQSFSDIWSFKVCYSLSFHLSSLCFISSFTSKHIRI